MCRVGFSAVIGDLKGPVAPFPRFFSAIPIVQRKTTVDLTICSGQQDGMPLTQLFNLAAEMRRFGAVSLRKPASRTRVRSDAYIQACRTSVLGAFSNR
jgi:hypothetical protein